MNKLILGIFAVLVLAGCEGQPADRLQKSIDTTSPAAIFNPSASEIPFPSDLLFQGSTDGTLNIPVADPADVSDPAVAMNTLDGFSTVAPISTSFGSAIDPDTIPGNVRVFEVTTNPSTGAITGVVRELIPYNGTVGEFAATVASQTTLVISPLVPLKEKTSYAVVITSGLTNTTGTPFKPDTTYALTKQTTSLLNGSSSAIPALTDAEAQQLEPLRMLTLNNEGQIAAVASPAIATADIILSWEFTTQSIGDVLAKEEADISGGAAPAATLADSGVDSPLGAANIYVGTIDVPYYLATPANANDPTPLTSYWKGAGGSFLTRYNTDAVPVSTQTIPMMVSVPKTATLDSGNIPVVIYQHGITTNRATILAVADGLAAKGFAVVAIDLPLHGLTGNETDGTAAFKTPYERTFDLDLVTQDPVTGAITAAVPDGVIDSSGRHFIQLGSLLTSRDLVRQAITDLFTVTKSIATLNVNGGAADFDASNIYFLGHSLGGIVGVPFLALEPGVKDAVIAMAGGGIPKILDGSATFGPEIASGLALNGGLIKTTADYEAFFGAAQTVLDTTDPINFANGAVGDTDHAGGALAGRNLLFFEVVGGAGSPSDLVIPNRVPDSNDVAGTVAAPLAGTDPLVGPAGMNLTQTNTNNSTGNLLVRFSAGHHGSLLTPTNISGNVNVSSSAEVFAEMQTQMSSYLDSSFNTSTATLTVADPNVIAAP